MGIKEFKKKEIDFRFLKMSAEDVVSIEAPIIGSHNDYLANQVTQVQSKTVPWEVRTLTLIVKGYQKASLITEQELQQIRQFESETRASLSLVSAHYSLTLKEGGILSGFILEIVGQIVKSRHAPEYPCLAEFLHLLCVYLLFNSFALVSEHGHAQLLRLSETKNDPLLPFATFIKYALNVLNLARLLTKEDEMVQLLSGKILVFLVAYVIFLFS